jgi:hypothetical protein
MIFGMEPAAASETRVGSAVLRATAGVRTPVVRLVARALAAAAGPDPGPLVIWIAASRADAEALGAVTGPAALAATVIPLDGRPIRIVLRAAAVTEAAQDGRPGFWALAAALAHEIVHARSPLARDTRLGALAADEAAAYRAGFAVLCRRPGGRAATAASECVEVRAWLESPYERRLLDAAVVGGSRVEAVSPAALDAALGDVLALLIRARAAGSDALGCATPRLRALFAPSWPAVEAELRVLDARPFDAAAVGAIDDAAADIRLRAVRTARGCQSY